MSIGVMPLQGPVVAQVCLHGGSGGAEHYLLALAQGLSTSRPTVVIAAEGSWLAQEAEASGLTVATVPEPRGRLSIPTIVRLVSLFRSMSVGVVHSHLGISDWYSWMAAKVAPNIVLVSTEHGISANRPDIFARTPFKRFVHKTAHRLRLHSLHATIAVSVYTRAALQMRYGRATSGRVVVIPAGIDLSRFPLDACAKPGSRPGPLRLVYVGRMEPEKGPDLLLEAVRICASRGTALDLTMVGEGNMRSALEHSWEPSASAEVRWVGHVLDTRPFLQEADVLALPSRSENLPTVILEAMAAGLPVIATDVGGVSEVVKNCATGLLVKPEDPSALAEAIAACDSDRATLAEMGAAARRLAADFDIRRMTESISGVYDQILARRSPSERAEG